MRTRLLVLSFVLAWGKAKGASDPLSPAMAAGRGVIDTVAQPVGSKAEDRLISVGDDRGGTVDVSRSGFDPADATDALQTSIDAGARRVRVPFMGAPWVIRPVRLRSNLELVFEPGVIVLAKAGEFRGGGDCLFRAVDCTNILVRGAGATLRMRKKDYQNPPYTRAEWRMGLSFTGCKDVTVEGLRIESTGGDGIYIGSSGARRWCENVTVRNCACVDNHRQGISVISAVHLLIEDCILSGTEGTAPAAGIDMEPDEPDERLVDCVIRNCMVTDNDGNGMLVYLKPLTAASEPVSIRFENCHVGMGAPGVDPDALKARGAGGWSGIAVGEVRDDGPRGLIEFVRCTSENTGREAVRLTNKSAAGARVRFVECRWKNAWTARHRRYTGPRVPILIRATAPERCSEPGGVEFVNCRVDDDLDGPIVRFESDTEAGGVRLADVSGTIVAANVKGGGTRFGGRTRDVTLNVIGHPKRETP